jgi:phage gp36-like protein
MQNGNVNGAGAQQAVQVNVQQAAAFALQFLARAPTTRAERDSYDMAEMFLQAIANGQVMVAPAPQPQPVQVAPVEPAPGDAVQ